MHGPGGADPAANLTYTITNTIGYDLDHGINVEQDFNFPLIVDHVTIGKLNGVSCPSCPFNGWGVYGHDGTGDTNCVITNSIVFNTESGSGALYRMRGANNYNAFWNNTTNYNQSTAGANDITNVNPLTSSLLYLPRIEPGSPLAGRGASIMKKRGVSGTLWGQTGYDTLTNEDLWPFPNEARIKTDFASWVGPPSGKRGFAADGSGLYGGPITLTSYIWEYLGNPMPDDIYSAPPPPPAPIVPAAPTNLRRIE
jgi:hypothetical protein